MMEQLQTPTLPTHTHIGRSEQMTDYHLRLLPFPDLFRLFHTLPAPSAPLEGEYLAEMLECVHMECVCPGGAGMIEFVHSTHTFGTFLFDLGPYRRLTMNPLFFPPCQTKIQSSGSFLANVLAWASFSPFYPGRWIGKVSGGKLETGICVSIRSVGRSVGQYGVGRIDRAG